MLKWCTNIRYTWQWYWKKAPNTNTIHTQMILKWYWNDVPIIKHTCKWYWNEVPIINHTFDWYWNDTPNKIQTNTKFSKEQIKTRNLYHTRLSGCYAPYILGCPLGSSFYQCLYQ